MKQAFPSIPEATKERLAAKGFTPVKAPLLEPWQNPHSSEYLGTNLLIIGLGLFGRHHAIKVRSPTIMWTSMIVSCPLLTLASRVRLDRREPLVGHRKTLEERLDYNPLTRNAWEKAKKLNDEYQDEIRREIRDLEAKVWEMERK